MSDDTDTLMKQTLIPFGVVFLLLAILSCLCDCYRKSHPTKTPDLEMAYAQVEATPHRAHTTATAATPVPTQRSEPANSASRAPSIQADSAPRSVTSSVTGSTGSSNRRIQSAAETTVLRLWHDPAIQRANIPLDEIHLSKVLNRGAYGEVYRGVYDGEPVAVKRLLPARRQDMKEIATFLEEAKLMTTLRHRNIVRLVGVAWNTEADLTRDALQDLSIVSELMEGGDLRSLLSHYNDTNAPRGFHSDNVRVAMDIARALVYLHSRQPSAVVHRDLKSKNVLLTRDLDAKLTDFGVSREQAEATMTAGVGSYLWMAPEIVFGKRYDEKADLFSFGVVLSELDTHELPYTNATDTGFGRKLTEITIVKMVSEGALSVEFSSGADEEIVALAKACICHEPSRRPTAREALTRLEKCTLRLTRMSDPMSQRGQTATLTSRIY